MRVWACVLLLAAAAAARRPDDFEFDDDAEGGAARRPRRFLYDPHSPLCRALECGARESCLLRDARTALCASRERLLRDGDVIVNVDNSAEDRGEGREPAPGTAGRRGSDWERDDDVFYDAGLRSDEPAERAERAELVEPAPKDKPNRCVGCGSAPRASFLCGSDNRTYSSLCRLDLHNCVRRPRAPVTLACRGFCPCGRARAPRRWGRKRQESNEIRGRTARGGRRGGARDSEGAGRRRTESEGAGCALDKMADRLLDWFSVLMDEAGATPPDRHGFPRDCKPETRWMFAHLDADGDRLLSAAELYPLRHDDRERCLRPFLSSCGAGGATDASDGTGAAGAAAGRGVSRAAWCGCLRRATRPCTALARAHPNPHPGAYVPACDAAGYYRARQCHAALAVCWCVDAHGVERAGSRTKGAPACPGEKLSENAISLVNETGEEAQEAREAREGGAGDAREGEARGAPADDEDALAGGSGDQELRF